MKVSLVARYLVKEETHEGLATREKYLFYKGST